MSRTVHQEVAFEDALTEHLTTHGGWEPGDPAHWDRERGLFPDHLLAYVQATQPDLWTQLTKDHGAGLPDALLQALDKELRRRGVLHVLRRGFKLHGKRVGCATFAPASGLNPALAAAYDANRLVATRQVHCFGPAQHSVDVMLSLNGLPIALLELKNHLTKQDVDHGMAQVRRRDPRDRIFQWQKGGALVHFVVDPELVRMTTQARGKRTRFLPFDRGHAGGKGNPPPSDPTSYASAYLWEQVLPRDSFLDIVGRFLLVKKGEKDERTGKRGPDALIFPRYHQLDAVRRLTDAARDEGPGQSYLIQHSAGSGKSNSISWLAHRLASLHDAEDQRVFHSVVVVTDRRVLDRQLQGTIEQIDHTGGVVAAIDQDSTQLAQALLDGKPIVVTTMQKFPFVSEKIGALPERRYAVIVDEAHGSQGGETARQMKDVLRAKDLEQAAATERGDDRTWEDELRETMASRGRQPNLSFFAFTATPKAKTLELFGRAGEDGRPRPFHLYTMRQAIEEGFILDVLQNYTTYKTYYRLVKSTEDDPDVPKREAARSLARFMSLHPHNVAQKTEVIVEHFRRHVQHRIGGRAKAMVVTASRLHAVRYKQAFDRYLAEQGYDDLGVLVAFSGTVVDPEDEAEHREPQMNRDRQGRSVPEARLPEVFASDDFHLLLVAEKFQTGFDQPLLHTMYVDKRLHGVHAVQTLSRLNRTHPDKEDTFVLDFVNDAEELQAAFQPFYEETEVAEATDPEHLLQLQANLEDSGVFLREEVEGICKAYFGHYSKASLRHAQLYHWLRPGEDRFRDLDEDAQEEFRNALKAFLRLYGFLSQVMPWLDEELEKLYLYGRLLERKLPRYPQQRSLDLDDDVALEYYQLRRTFQGDIDLSEGEAMPLKPATDVGTRNAEDEEAKLSEIIQVLNDRFATEFDEADNLLFDQFTAEACGNEEVVERALANSLENFGLSMGPRIQSLMLGRLDDNQAIVERYLDDPDFQKVVQELLVKRIYEDIRARA